MSYDSVEKSGSGSLPFELYLFSTTGQTFALTSADAPISYIGQIFTPTVISRGEIDQSQEMNAGQMRVTVPKGHPLAALFVPYLPPTPVRLTIFGGHVGDAEISTIFVGEVASARYTEQCELTCVPEQAKLKRKIPALLYQSGCPRVFGDAGCGISLGAHTSTASIGAIDSSGCVLTIAAFAGLGTSLRGGYLKRGNDVRMIVDHSGATVTIIAAISSLQVGDVVSGIAGCAHTYAACAAYGNVTNFLGFDLIPSSNPFYGSLE